jgi:hypothetical protein
MATQYKTCLFPDCTSVQVEVLAYDSTNDQVYVSYGNSKVWVSSLWLVE